MAAQADALKKPARSVSELLDTLSGNGLVQPVATLRDLLGTAMKGQPIGPCERHPTWQGGDRSGVRSVRQAAVPGLPCCLRCAGPFGGARRRRTVYPLRMLRIGLLSEYGLYRLQNPHVSGI